MCLMFALLDCFLKRYIQQNEECKHQNKAKNYFLFAESSKFGKVQMGHIICHVHLCVTINHSLSLYHCREDKPTFQSIMIDDESNIFSLFPQNTARIVNKKVNNNKTLLFSCLIITTNLLSQLIFYRAAGKMSCSLNRLVSVIFSVSLFFILFFEVIICSFIKLRNLN